MNISTDDHNKAIELANAAGDLLAKSVHAPNAVASHAHNLAMKLMDRAAGLLTVSLKVEAEKNHITIGVDGPITVKGHIHSTMHSVEESKARINEIIDGAHALVDARPHASDCSTNNRGVPELLGDCDCYQPRVVKTPAREAYEQQTYGHFPLLHEYLAKANRKGVIDHVVRVVMVDGNRVEAYIRPMNTSGDTMSFNVLGDVPKATCARA